MGFFLEVRGKQGTYSFLSTYCMPASGTDTENAEMKEFPGIRVHSPYREVCLLFSLSHHLLSSFSSRSPIL
jgi:hypothetical protein